MIVLIADMLPPLVQERLETFGATVVVEPSLKDEHLETRLREVGPAVLLVRSTKVKANHFAAAPSLELVVRAGAGVNTIDLEAASARAVSVANCPGMNAIAVAELALGHILNADRRIADNVRDLRAGQWRKKHYAKAQGLKGNTLGVIGAGAIAQAVIARAQAFEMTIACYAPELDAQTADALGVIHCASVLDVARRCSILTVHVPLNPATRHLIGAEVLAALPDGATVVNTSRGGIIDEEALAHAVTERGFRAGLDVLEDEPASDGPFTSTIGSMDGVYATHHIGASSNQAQVAVAEEVCRIVDVWQRTGEAPNCVNLRTVSVATHNLVVRHLDRVGVLAGLLELLREQGINVQRMRNVIYSGEQGAACARIKTVGAPSDAAISKMKALEHILDVAVLEL